MTNYLIVDSNKIFAEKFHILLANGTLVENVNYWDSSVFPNTAELSESIMPRISERTILLISTEATVQNSYLQNQSLVDLAFWLRCKHQIKNPIVFYGTQTISRLLKRKPANFILHSPGCYYLKFPFEEDPLENIERLEELGQLHSIRPFLKARIDLVQTRHDYANYTGMALMLNVIKAVYKQDHINKTLGKSSKYREEYKGFYGFFESLDYHLLEAYYGLETKISADVSAREDLRVGDSKQRILLIDDLAENGWKRIISQMIYGTSESSRLCILKMRYEVVNEKKILDFDKTLEELRSTIISEKPHLILLDLRLDSEKVKESVDEFSGAKLLKNIKSDSDLQGVPVIMFTASSNAEIVKELIKDGAESVWTKPGIDEGLNSSEIVKRYSALIEYVRDVFNKFADVKYYAQRKSTLDPSEFRIQLLRKIEWVKYRLKLHEKEFTVIQKNSAFADYTDIYFDTNFLMTSFTNFDVIESLCSLLTISSITANTHKTYEYDGKEFSYVEPKVVISNQVLDELIKKIKTDQNADNAHVNNLVYLIVRELFSRKFIRTEYELYTQDRNFKPSYRLSSPKENLYADPFIIDDISQLIILRYKKIKCRETNRVVEKTVGLPGRNVLLVTDDSDLKAKASRIFKNANFTGYSISNFNTYVKEIAL